MKSAFGVSIHGFVDVFGEDNEVVVAQLVRVRGDHGGKGVHPRLHDGEGLGKHDAHLVEGFRFEALMDLTKPPLDDQGPEPARC